MNHNEPDSIIARPTSSETTPPVPPRLLDSSELLLGDKEVLIQHDGEVYRLRLTKNGKLILQK